VGLHAHDQIEGDKGKDKSVGQNIEHAQYRHFFLIARDLLFTACLASKEKAPQWTLLLFRIQLEAQGIVQISEPYSVQEQETNKVSGKEEGYVEPQLFAMFVVQPGEEILPSYKEQDEESK
jgi:hypothetical protein